MRISSEMSLNKVYTDTHGQSELAFAFCYLLGFELIPHIKAIFSQKLYIPDKGIRYLYPKLDLSAVI